MHLIDIKRGYEVLPDNNIRFGIRITNISDLAVSDVEVILDYNETLFKLEGERVQKVGVIPPSGERTAEFVLKPLACIHKVNIEALVSYRDAKWERYRVDMRPKEVHCVCPFLKGKKMARAEFLELSGAGHSAETGLNFKGVTVDRLTSFLVHTCKSRHYKVDDFSIDGGRMLYLASESIGEKAYYLLTALIKEENDLTQVMLKAVSDKPHGLNGFLNETVADLRHVVSAVRSAQEIGVIKKEQVINIIDSVVQRTTFAGGEGGASVNIKDSVVQRTEFKGDEERKRRDEERRRKEREEQERLRRQREEEEQAQREKEEEERQRMEEEQRREKQEKYEAFLLKQKKEEEERKVREERERKAEAERSGREKQNAIQEEDRQRRQMEEAARIQRKDGERTSRNKFYAVALVLGLLALGYWALAPSSIDSTSASSPKSASSASSYFPSQNNTPKIILNFSSSDTLDINNVNFSHENWGKYQVVYFNGEKYFAGYQKGEISDKDITLLDSDLLSRVFIDDGSKRAISEGGTLTLKDGYNIRVDSIDVSTGKIQFVLLKNGNKVYSTTADGRGTYVYSRNVGNINNVPIIAIYFDTVFRGREINAAFILGVFQISETPIGIRRVNSEPSTVSSAPLAPLAAPVADQKTYTNSIGMEFVSISSGEFDMGSPSNEAGRSNEDPVHHVKISSAFYMGKYEVTQKQWRDVMGSSPSYFKGDDLPVEQVSWNDVQDFIKILNEKEGGGKYRLPTEAEWEYAARAGTTTRFSFGDDESKLGDYAWYGSNSGSKTLGVGKKKPNPWGLYDMHGNVWEWVQDSWHDNYDGAPTDGSSWESGSGSVRVLRGGYWCINALRCRSASRDGGDPGYRDSILGFRLLRIS